MQEYKFELTLTTLNKIADYLSKKPYFEVVNLIQELGSLPPLTATNAPEQPAAQAEPKQDA